MKESFVLRQVLDYLKAREVFAFRLGTGRFFFEGRTFQAHSLGRGAADILVPAQGSLWIEVKNECGRQTAEQRSFEAFVVDQGHRYVVARSIDDLEPLELGKSI